MPRKPLAFFLMIACAACLWLVTISLLFGRGAAGAGKKGGDGSKDDFLSTSFSLVDQALAAKPQKPVRYFTGDFQSPFKTAGEARREERPPAPAAVPPGARPRLVLKGVLYKSSPLSILEDESGKTFIAGVGDTVRLQAIVFIGKNTVKLKDGHGTYELTVKE